MKIHEIQVSKLKSREKKRQFDEKFDVTENIHWILDNLVGVFGKFISIICWMFAISFPKSKFVSTFLPAKVCEIASENSNRSFILNFCWNTAVRQPFLYPILCKHEYLTINLLPYIPILIYAYIPILISAYISTFLYLQFNHEPFSRTRLLRCLS